MKGGDNMSDINDWLRNINKIQRQIRNINGKFLPQDSPAMNFINQQKRFHTKFNNQIFANNSHLKELTDRQRKSYNKINGQLPRAVREYNSIKDTSAFHRSLQNMQKIKGSNNLSYQNVARIQSVIKNIQRLNNSELNSQISQMTKTFGYPGSTLTSSQKENIARFKSNLSSEKFDDDVSENKNVSKDSKDNDDLQKSHNSNPVGDVKSQVDMDRNPNPKEEIADEKDNVDSTLSKEELKYFNELSGNNDSLLPWAIMVDMANGFIGSVTNPMPIMIISVLLTSAGIILDKVKKN